MKITISLVARSGTKSGSEISKLAGLTSDECKEKGATSRPGQTPTIETVWKLNVSTSDPEGFDNAVDAICQRIEPHIGEMRRIGDAVTFDLDCVVALDDGQKAPNLGLSKRAVRLLGDLGAELGISFY